MNGVWRVQGVFGNRFGVAIPMSYDHKPCQLKEKKRIQEAGGFVAMNGVWRVQGVLATSRALGDYPLKNKKVTMMGEFMRAANIPINDPVNESSDGINAPKIP